MYIYMLIVRNILKTMEWWWIECFYNSSRRVIGQNCQDFRSIFFYNSPWRIITSLNLCMHKLINFFISRNVKICWQAEVWWGDNSTTLTLRAAITIANQWTNIYMYIYSNIYIYICIYVSTFKSFKAKEKNTPLVWGGFWGINNFYVNEFCNY